MDWKALRPVVILWEDSAGDTGWKSIEEIREQSEDIECISIGFYVETTKNAVIIAQSFDGAAMHNFIAIPKKSILKTVSIGSRKKLVF